MKNEQLLRLAQIIDQLDANNLHLEAFLLNEEYIKLAQTDETVENVERLVGGMAADKAAELGGAKKITEKLIEKFPSKIKVNPGSALKGFGVGWITEMGLEYALDFFDSSKGPYQIYKSNKSDLDEILSIIGNLIKDSPRVSELVSEIEKLADQGMNKFDEGKKLVKTAFNINKKVVYNFKNQKIAIRGNAKSRVPEYLRTLFTGAAGGAAAGAVLGGPIGAVTGGLFGGAGNVLFAGAEDLWYENLSNTGKAYLQSKDLKDKVSKMYGALNQIDINLADNLLKKTNELESEVEQINLKNKNKNTFENLVQSAEEKLGLIGNKVKQNITESILDSPKDNQEVENSGSSTSYKFQPNRIL